MDKKLFIVFAENVGEDNEGKYFYRLLFSTDPSFKPNHIFQSVSGYPCSEQIFLTVSSDSKFQSAAEFVFVVMQGFKNVENAFTLSDLAHEQHMKLSVIDTCLRNGRRKWCDIVEYGYLVLRQSLSDEPFLP